MAKSKLVYSCTECGSQAPKWAGQCGDCGAWNTLVEVTAVGGGSRSARFTGFTGEASGQLSLIHISEPTRPY